MRSAYIPVRPKARRYQEIVVQIQRRILSGALEPGDQIPAERELAEQFGASRTAVREAIKSLGERGLIKVHIGRGTFVTEVSSDRLAESMALLLHKERDATASLSEARSVLEIPIARLAARHRTADHLERLAAILDRFDQLVDAPGALIDADDEFHSEMARATGNPVLVAMSEMMSALLREHRVQTAGHMSDVRGTIDAHRHLFDAINAGDENGAERELVRLLDSVRRGGENLHDREAVLTGTDGFAVD